MTTTAIALRQQRPGGTEPRFKVNGPTPGLLAAGLFALDLFASGLSTTGLSAAGLSAADFKNTFYRHV